MINKKILVGTVAVAALLVGVYSHAKSGSEFQAWTNLSASPSPTVTNTQPVEFKFSGTGFIGNSPVQTPVSGSSYFAGIHFLNNSQNTQVQVYDPNTKTKSNVLTIAGDSIACLAKKSKENNIQYVLSFNYNQNPSATQQLTVSFPVSGCN